MEIFNSIKYITMTENGETKIGEKFPPDKALNKLKINFISDPDTTNSSVPLSTEITVDFF
ncbi:hypothetical protein DERP_002181 [Dermatophagoides pteronyssinus]|uniref:Uncharacterized protein n=1 Tax=Dermatophagoides pteronyssinus TaxID=6956 RepID=A0ABQ8JGZ9_DERPT|nr:hypothetical protein DERP_002181 [Dermatophagoides pteronyssinus]